MSDKTLTDKRIFVVPASGSTEKLAGFLEIHSGSPFPLGAYSYEEGINFAIYSRHATRVRIDFFQKATDEEPSFSIELNEKCNKTGDVWHIWLKGLKDGQLYGYRIDGPYQPENGHLFNFNNLLLDPFASVLTPIQNWDFKKCLGYNKNNPNVPSSSNNAGSMPKCVLTHNEYNWVFDNALIYPWSQVIIYETHVRGLTIHPSANAINPGTYKALLDKIPYFKDLGVTVIELMPVQEFNHTNVIGHNSKGEPLRNYWGYDPVLLGAPKASYSSKEELGQGKIEFKEMVRALHQAGIEVILDVVFNHTAESDEFGPTFSFKGIDNSIYYMLKVDKQQYQNFSGTGNTINTNHPAVREQILDLLRRWVIEMHIDGFRFDLASILGRDESGNLLPDASLLNRISEDPILRNVRLIAEGWDTTGYYFAGHFAKMNWSEWNGHYRDDVKQFWRGDPDKLRAFANRITGSSDMFFQNGKGPEHSINYITCHDGFTLNDLVSYNEKHNEENGQQNQDGSTNNYSYNYGIEGPTNDLAIEQIRIQQIKNFILTLFISLGVPMLLGGDEFRRTQRGNNNAYCQDNEISWYDWRLLQSNIEIFRFTKRMIAFRKNHPVLSQAEFYKPNQALWYNAKGEEPDWFNPDEKSLGFFIKEKEMDQNAETIAIYIMFNASLSDLLFTIPAEDVLYARWYMVADTSKAAPNDLYSQGEEVLIADQKTYLVKSRTSVILLCK